MKKQRPKSGGSIQHISALLPVESGHSGLTNCNMTTRTVFDNTSTLTFNYENQLTTVSVATPGSFSYDGDGKRVKGTVGGVTTAYVGNYFEWTSAGSTAYYYASGQRIAMRRAGYSSDNGLFWLLGDHLGSTTVTANNAGMRTAELRYKPWGQARTGVGTTRTSYRFTGQRSEEAGIGLYWYNSRWYDALIGRFASPDSIIPQNQGTQAWDRYSYVNNSPLNYTDPTGHDLEQIIFNKTGALPKSQQPPSHKISQKTPQPTLPPRGLVIPNNNFPTPADQNGFSDPALDAWFTFWDDVALPFFDSVEAYDVYRFTSKGGYRAFRYALPTGYIEAGVAGFQQGYVDNRNSSLSTYEKGVRIAIVSVETLIIDYAASAVGGAGAALGAELGPPGAFAGFFIGTTLGTAAGDLFFSSINQQFNFFGVWR